MVLTYDQAHHGAQVSRAAAEVQERQTLLEFQGFHHLRVDTRRWQVYIPVLPRQILVGIVSVAVQVIISTVYGPKGLLHTVCADVLCFLQVVYQIVVVLASADSSPMIPSKKRNKPKKKKNAEEVRDG